jgi:hypothetical protein
MPTVPSHEVPLHPGTQWHVPLTQKPRPEHPPTQPVWYTVALAIDVSFVTATSTMHACSSAPDRPMPEHVLLASC